MKAGWSEFATGVNIRVTSRKVATFGVPAVLDP